MNITKIANGFSLNKKNYTFKNFVVMKDSSEVEVPTDVINEKVAHVGTDKGIICITLDVKLNGEIYTTIDDLLTNLYK